MAGKLSKLKVSELKDKVRELTNEINTEIKNYRQQGRDEFYINENIEKLKLYGGKGRGNEEIGYGLRGKKKVELVRQVRELEYFKGLGIDTIAGQIALENKYKNIYEAVRQTVDLDEEEFRQITESFGALGKDIVSKYESFTIIDKYKEMGKNINLVKLMKETLEDSENAGLDTKQLTDKLIDRMRKEI